VLSAACVTLAVLFALVGLKAGADQLKFTDEYAKRYTKPMLAFEFNAGEWEKMFTPESDAKRVLRTALMWDFLFIFIYPAFITAVCLVGARYLDAHGYVGFRVSLFFILLALVAAVLDAVENCALLAVLADYQSAALPSVASLCAKLKFTLAIIAAVYALLACAAALVLWLYNSFAGRAPVTP
jgi:hypothetical protein